MANDKTINPAIGRMLVHYRILRKLGAGGMGEVFLAEDTKLERKVAVKMLPVEVASNRERMRRFVLEAKAASSLNHPNIAHIYEIGDADDTSFIAMEFVEGETLREKIRARTVDLPTLLKYLAQVADGLAKAHAAGIVHRDLKPDNIMISRDGFAKILDFGLAKLIETKSPPNDGEPNEEAVTAMLPPQPLSTPGMILGTIGYMSPEQAKGRKEIDQRSDVFSFGCVLFEAATGRAPFAGDSAVDVLHKIINQPAPPVRDYNPEAPADLQRIVRRCLEKDPEERFQSIKDVSLELKELRREMRGEAEIHYSTAPPNSSDSGDENAAKFLTVNQSTNQTEAQTGEANSIHTTSSAEYIVGEIKRHKTGAAAAFVAFVLILGGAGYGIYKLLEGRGAASPFQTFKITRLTNTGKANDAVISPDGRYVVHVVDEGGQQSLWVRQVATTSNVQIVAPAETAYLGLTFSRDGDYIYYVTREGNSPQGNLYQIPVLGGTPRKVIDDVDTPVGFSPDQKRLAFIRNVPGEGASHLVVANADGGGEQMLATLKRPDHFPILAARSPAWSPDGKTIACVIGRTDANGTYQNVAVVDASSGALKELNSQRWFNVGRAAWLADGAGLLIVAAETPGTNQVYYVSYPDGELRRVTNDLNNYFGISLKADGSAFATVQRVTTANIWVAPAADAAAGKQITSGGSKLDGFWGASFAPDGRIVYFSTAGGGGDLWVMKPDGSEQRQLTSNAGGNIFPTVSSDGRYIAFVSSRTGTFLLWRMDADGGSLKQLSSQIFIDSPDFSPDGRRVIYPSTTPRGLSKVSVDGGEPVPVHQGFSEFPRVSPDGKFIACIYRESPAARYQLAILPFEGGQIIKTFDVPRTFERTRGLRWSPDGRAVYYIDSRGGVSNIWSQLVEGGQPKQLTNFKSDLIFAFDLSRDGKQFVFSRGTVTSDVVLIGDSR